jgi:ketosteroid isomerase-like protein
MSQENVDAVSRIHAVWEAEGSPVRSGLLDAGMEWAGPPDTDGMRIDEMLDLGERVVVLVTLHEGGPDGDADLERRQGYVWTLRDGKAIRFEWFADPDEALRAAGVHCSR